jgi:hypothetical protein
MPPRYPLLEIAAPRPLPVDGSAEFQLRVALVHHFRVTMRQGEPHLGAMHRAVLRFLRRRQAILRIVAETRRNLERHAGVGTAARAFGAASIESHHGLPDAAGMHRSGLVEELEEIFGIHISIDKDVIELTGRMENELQMRQA